MTDHHDDDLAARNAAKDARRLGGTTGIAYALTAIAHAILHHADKEPR